MELFDILVGNGFSYDYLRTVEAKSWKAARKWFKDAYIGDYRSRDFKVRKSYQN